MAVAAAAVEGPIAGTEWERIADDAGDLYFANVATGETSWIAPPEVVAAEAPQPAQDQSAPASEPEAEAQPEPEVDAEAEAKPEPSYYVYDDETKAHAGPFSRLEMVTKGYPTDTLVCLGDGNGGFGEWQDVTELITPPDELPREEDAYREEQGDPGRRGRGGSSTMTRQQSATAAGELFKQSSRNMKARSAVERVSGSPG